MDRRIKDLLDYIQGAKDILEGKCEGAGVTNALLNLDAMEAIVKSLHAPQREHHVSAKTYVVLPCWRVGEDDMAWRRVVIVNLGKRRAEEGPAALVGMAVDYTQENIIAGGDEEFWGFSFGSHVEHAGDGHYYVPRDPGPDEDEDDEETAYEHCEALPSLATIVHSMHDALEAARELGDDNPYRIKP